MDVVEKLDAVNRVAQEVAGVDVKKISASVDKLKAVTKEHLHQLNHAELVGAAIAGSGDSIFRMVSAFKANQPEQGGAEIIRLTANLAKFGFIFNYATKAAGPLGMVLGELLSLAAAFVGAQGEAEKSLKHQLKEEINEFGTKTHADELEGVLDQLQILGADLASYDANTLPWQRVSEIGQFAGEQVIALGSAESWLLREQKPEYWGVLLRTFLEVYVFRLKNVTLGLRILKSMSDDGKPTSEITHALAVVQVIFDQAGEALTGIEPTIKPHETRYFIGKNTSVYKTDFNGDQRVTPYDGEARRLAIGLDGERLWTIGTNYSIYTMHKDKEWLRVDADNKYDDVVVVANSVTSSTSTTTTTTTTSTSSSSSTSSGAGENTGNSYQVLTLREGFLKCHSWNEKTRTFATVETPQFKNAIVGKVTRLAAVQSDQVFALVDGAGLWFADANSCALIDTPKPTELTEVVTTRDVVYICSQKQMWFKLRNGAATSSESNSSKWVEIAWPKALVDDSHQISSLSSCIDGLIAIIDFHMYFWEQLTQKWRLVDNNTARQVVTVPVRGWESVAALQAGLLELKNAKDVLTPKS